MAAGQFSDGVKLSKVPGANFVTGRRKEAEARRRERDVVDLVLARRHGQGPAVGRVKCDRAVRRQATRGESLDAGRRAAHPEVPHFDESRRSREGQTHWFRVLDYDDVVGVTSEALELFLSAKVPDFDRPVFRCAEEKVVGGKDREDSLVVAFGDVCADERTFRSDSSLVRMDDAFVGFRRLANVRTGDQSVKNVFPGFIATALTSIRRWRSGRRRILMISVVEFQRRIEFA